MKAQHNIQIKHNESSKRLQHNGIKRKIEQHENQVNTMQQHSIAYRKSRPRNYLIYVSLLQVAAWLITRWSRSP